MKEIKYKAMPVIVDMYDFEEVEWLVSADYFRDGYIYGSLIWNGGRPFIVGDVVESTDEYITLEYWCPVVAETIIQVEEI